MVASPALVGGSGRGGCCGVGGEGDVVQKADVTHSHCLPNAIVWQRNSMLTALGTKHLIQKPGSVMHIYEGQV